MQRYNNMDFYNVITNIPLHEVSSSPFTNDVMQKNNFEYPDDKWNSRTYMNFGSKYSEALEYDNYDDTYGFGFEDTITSTNFFLEESGKSAMSENSWIDMSSYDNENNAMDIDSGVNNGIDDCKFKGSAEPEIAHVVIETNWDISSYLNEQEKVKQSFNDVQKSFEMLNPSYDIENKKGCILTKMTDYAVKKAKIMSKPETSGGGIIQWVYKELCQGSNFLEWLNRPLLIFRIKPETKEQLASAWFDTRKTKEKERDASNNYDYFARLLRFHYGKSKHKELSRPGKKHFVYQLSRCDAVKRFLEQEDLEVPWVPSYSESH